MNKRRVMFNQDSDSFLVWLKNKKIEPSKELIRQYAKRYFNGLTDFIICVNADVSTYPSKTRESLVDKYYKKTEMGKPVDYTSKDCMAYQAYNLFVNNKIDCFEEWINVCNENNVNPWLSFRLNDVHNTFDHEIPNVIKSDFFYEHKNDYTIMRHRHQVGYFDANYLPEVKTGYFDRCFDYSLPQVRKRALDYIDETLDKYNPYGIELDFQRDMFCFAIGKESQGRKIMQQFLTDIKAILKKYENKYNHSIKVAFRCMIEPQYNYELGFDIIQYARDGLIDMVIPTPRWGNTNYDIPVKLWKDLLFGTNVEVLFGLELNVTTNSNARLAREVHTIDTIKGFTSTVLSEGADGVYFFNFYSFDESVLGAQDPNDWNNNSTAYEKSEEVYRKLFTIKDNDCFEPRRHLCTFEDLVPFWRECRKPLPFTLDENTFIKYVKVNTGFIPEKSKVILKLGIEKPINENDFTLFVNGKKVKFLRVDEKCAPFIIDAPIYCFEIENNGDLGDAQIVEIYSPNKKMKVLHIEIDVNME